MKILLLSRYDNLGASSRYRSFQYLSYLREQGFEVTVAPLLNNAYVQRLYSGQRASFLSVGYSYVLRVLRLFQSSHYELIWFEKEAFPWVPAQLEALLFKFGVPYVADYDDAWFHRYDQHKSSAIRCLLSKKIDSVMRGAALVIAGNAYLANHAIEVGARRVEILPTVIDLNRYPLVSPPENKVFTIGWIGSPSTAPYLSEIHFALKEVCRDGAARVVAVGISELDLVGVPLDVKSWSKATEVQEIQQFDVGIMPLPDYPWTRGKCGSKLIQYMGCSRPVVASPVGVNQDIVVEGVNGFLASCKEEWVRALQILKNDKILRRRMGEAGRMQVEERYCLQVTAPRLAQLLLESARA